LRDVNPNSKTKKQQFWFVPQTWIVLPPQKKRFKPSTLLGFCVAARNWVGLKLRGEDEEIEAPVLLKTWDFGGQREYYDTWIGKF